MTVMELRTAYLKLDYDIPIEMFTYAWTRHQVRKLHNYFMWRMAPHRNCGRPCVEPACIMPFKIKHPHKNRRIRDIEDGYKICWSLNESGDLPIRRPVTTEHGVVLRVLTKEERAAKP